MESHVSPEIIATIGTGVALILAVGGVVWRLAGRLSSLDAHVSSAAAQMDLIGSQVREIKLSLSETRVEREAIRESGATARQALWNELNHTKERVAVVETRLRDHMAAGKG